MGNISVKKLHSFLGHNDSIYALEAIDDHRFISAGGDGMVVMWDLEVPDEGMVVAKIQGSVYAMAYDESEGFLYIGQNNDGIHKIDLATKKEIKSINLGDHQIFDIKIIDGKIWSGLSSGELVLLTTDFNILHREKYASDRARSIDVKGNEVSVSFSDNITRILDIKTLEVIKELKGHKNSVFSSKYHPSGKYLVSVGRDAHIKVWDTSENYLLRESIAAHLYTINDVFFRKDGRYFVTASMDKSVKLWDAYNFQLIKVLDKHRHAGHGNSVNGLLWMNYQDLLVTCSDDRSISVWELNFE
ncbi:MAG: WD40 repeat domain-containing protein [Bacteroidota bacterium]